MAERTIPGTVRQGERPVWQPLVDVVGEDRRAFLYRSEDSYDEIPLLRAIHLAFAGWEVPDPE